MKLHAFQVMVNQHDMGTILHLTKNLLNYNQLLKSFLLFLMPRQVIYSAESFVMVICQAKLELTFSK